MQNRFIVLIALILAGQGISTQAQHHDYVWAKSPYFNTKFLLQYDLVEEVLIQQEQFESVTFESSDGLKLSGLLLRQRNAIGTIVFCAGFFPGRKEGQTPIFKMLPPNYNILCFDARGHAQSEGPFWTNLAHYGEHEYKDVLGALSFVHETFGGDIIVYGVCAGAFHASHALINLAQENKLEQLNVKGLIFDSGFASCVSVSKAIKFHLREKILPHLLNWYASKKTIRNTYLYKLSAFFLTRIGETIKSWFVMPGLRELEPETNLLEKLETLTCPILFIHSKDDNYAPFTETKELAQTIQNKTCWWIDNSSHALHALKHKYEYYRRLRSFLKEALG